MKFSTMSYTFSRQPDFLDLRKIMQFTAEHMDGIDLVGLHDKTAQDLRRLADDHAVRVVCHTMKASGLASTDPAARQEGLDDCKRGIEAALVLGAPIVMIPTGGSPGIPRGRWREQWIEGLREAVKIANAAGIILTVENFPGESSAFVLASDYHQARDEVAGLKLTFDNGNAGTGENAADSFRQCAEDVVHAHFKDWEITDKPSDGFRRMLDGRYYRGALIGEGQIDHLACLKAMREADYPGFINIEYEGNKYNPFEATRRATDYLRELADSTMGN